jgi:two-component system sensor histidine kinase KdpD
LRTPLAAIIGTANELAASRPLTEVQKDMTAEIESASARLNRLVESLLSAARLQSGQVRAKLEWCDTPELVQVARQGVEGLLAGHPVEEHIAPDLPFVKLDFVLMEQALANLLANAAIHTGNGTPIEINARLETNELVIEVADRGPGLPATETDKLFDLFHRAPNAKPGGSGLGLAIVKGFVEAQGGRVWASNRDGGGAIFGIRMPVHDEPDLPKEVI